MSQGELSLCKNRECAVGCRQSSQPDNCHLGRLTVPTCDSLFHLGLFTVYTPTESGREGHKRIQPLPTPCRQLSSNYTQPREGLGGACGPGRLGGKSTGTNSYCWSQAFKNAGLSPSFHVRCCALPPALTNSCIYNCVSDPC